MPTLYETEAQADAAILVAKEWTGRNVEFLKAPTPHYPCKVAVALVIDNQVSGWL